MTTIRTAGEAWAVGLTWHPRISARKLRRTARDAGAAAWLETATGTGLAGDEDGDPTDTPSLAAALIDHIADPAWIAVVDGGDGRIAMVRCESGDIGDEGDIVVDGTAEAARLLETMGPGYRVHASASLAIPHATALDLARVEIGDHHRLQAIPEPTGGGLASIVTAALLVAILGGAGGAAWIWRQDIMDWIDPPPPPVAEVEEEPQVVAMISTPALLHACAHALREVPPGLPAWILEEAACQAELVEAPVLQVVPDLQGHPALVLRWSLRGGHDPAIHRRLLEEPVPLTRRLLEPLSPVPRHAGIVHGSQAWAVTALAPVVVEVDPDRHIPDFRSLRAALDRRVGPWADSLSYAQLQPGQWSVTITGRGPLRRLAAALEPIAGLEVTSLRRAANGVWQIAARPLAPRTLVESAFLRLSSPAAGLYDAGASLHEGGN